MRHLGPVGACMYSSRGMCCSVNRNHIVWGNTHRMCELLRGVHESLCWSSAAEGKVDRWNSSCSGQCPKMCMTGTGTPNGDTGLLAFTRRELLYLL